MRNRKRVIALLLAVILAGTTMDLPGSVVSAADGVSCIENCGGIYINGICSKNSYHYQMAMDSNSDGYYEIGNAGQFFWFRDCVNSNPLNKVYNAVLVDDIVINEDLMSKITVASDGTATVNTGESVQQWVPIGTYVDKDGKEDTIKSKPYNGVFDGNNHTISGIYFNNTINSTSGNNAGLFGYVKNGTIQNVTLVDSYVAGTRWVGGIVGRNLGTVVNCSSTANVYVRDAYVGGIAGYSEGIIEKCYNRGNVGPDCNDLYNQFAAGGIAGSNYGGRIADCYNTGAVVADYRAGGIVGSNNNDTADSRNATIVRCYNTGAVSTTGNVYGYSVGGVAGVSGGTITFGYYLTGCAKDMKKVVQKGVGAGTAGSTTADVEGCTIGMDAEAFASGEVAYLLNGGVTDGSQLFYQTCGEGTPAFSGKTVYQVIGCDGKSTDYNNEDKPKDHVYNSYIVNEDTHTCVCRKCKDELSTEKHSENVVGDKVATCVSKAYCSVCQSEYGEIDANNHSYNDDGECQACSEDTVAKVLIDGEVTYFKGLQDAIDYAETRDGSHLKLLKNVYGIQSSISIDGGSFTLDLNGKNLGKENSVKQLIDFVDGELTICNSSADATSEIRASEGTYGIRISGGAVRLEGGTVNGIALDGGVLILDGAVVMRDVELGQGATLKLIDGNITGGIDMGDFTSCITVEAPLSETYAVYSSLGNVGKFAVAGEGVALNADNFLPTDDTLKVVHAADGLYLKKQIAAKITLEDAAEFIYIADTSQAPTIIADGVTLKTDYTILYESTDEGGYRDDVPPTNVGAYRVTVTGIGDYTGTLTDEWRIKQATPDIGTVTANELFDSLDISKIQLSRENESVPGTLQLTDMELDYGTNTYAWKFTPDNENYEIIAGTVSITVNDTIDPTATYRIGTGEWKSFGNNGAYDLFTKENQTIEIACADGGSGIESVQYYVSNEQVTPGGQIPWTVYDGKAISLEGANTYFVYVKVADNAGNSVTLCSEGIVIYEETEIEISELDYTYKMDEDRRVEIDLRGNTLKEIEDSAGKVLAATDYAVSVEEGVASITLKAAYLNTLNVGEYTYKVNLAPQGVENDASKLECSFVVNVKPAEVTVTEVKAIDRAYNGTDGVVITDVTLNGVKEPDAVSVDVTGLLGTLNGATVGTYTSVMLPELTLTNNEKGNYTLVQPTGAVATSVTISPADTVITVEQESYTKTYGDAAFMLEGITDTNTDADGIVEFTVSEGVDVVSVAADGTVTILKKGTATVTVSMQATTNYNAAESKSIVITVNPAELTVAEVKATDRAYNGTDAVAITDVTLNGIKEPDTVSVDVTNLQGTLNDTTVGTYTAVTLPVLTLTNNDNGNYILIQPTGAVATSVTISPADAVITVTQDSHTKTFGDEAFILEVTNTNTDAEAKVEYTVTEGVDVVSVAADGTVTILKEGTATITVFMQATTNYNAAESKTITIIINPIECAPNMPSDIMEVDVEKNVGEVKLPTNWVWDEADSNKALIAGEQTTATAIYNGADKDRYEIVEVVVTIIKQANPFGDVDEKDWYYPYVMFAYKHGFMGGKGSMPDGSLKFDPGNAITRAEFVQILYAKENYPAVEYVDTFTDVADEKWYTDAILWAAEEEIVGGKKADYFDVNGKITRQEIALILYKYALYKEYSVSEAENADLTGFADAASVATWAETGMKWAVEYNVIGGKIVNGETLLAPGGNAIRAEAATMLKAFVEAYE